MENSNGVQKTTNVGNEVLADVTSSFSYKCNGQDLTAKVTVTYSANRYHCEQIDKCTACGKYHIWDGWK